MLYKVPVVSDRDGIIRSTKKEYALVEYFNDNQFRKFLFKAETPQTFVAVAATAADVLAINKKYNLNIGLNLADFTSFYGPRAKEIDEPALPEYAVLYQLSYKDVNTPKSQLIWVLFENKKLSKTFYTRDEKDAYLKTLYQPISQTQAPAEQAAKSTKNKPTAPRKALVWGGTASDQAYMPKVVSPKLKPLFPVEQQDKSSEK